MLNTRTANLCLFPTYRFFWTSLLENAFRHFLSASAALRVSKFLSYFQALVNWANTLLIKLITARKKLFILWYCRAFYGHRLQRANYMKTYVQDNLHTFCLAVCVYQWPDLIFFLFYVPLVQNWFLNRYAAFCLLFFCWWHALLRATESRAQFEPDMIAWNVFSLSDCTLELCVCVCVYQTINV